MKKNYTKPVFVKTLYISIDMMANTTEEFSIMNSSVNLDNWFEEVEDGMISLAPGAPKHCSCDNCPADYSHQCGCSC